jgi:hypothetical protein
MGTKAVWHGMDLEVVDDDVDPLAARVEQVGLPITLHADFAELNERLLGLVNTEGSLYNAGITCAIRDRTDSTCLACPISAHEEKTELGALCRCGREQERVATELAVAREAKRAREQADLP